MTRRGQLSLRWLATCAAAALVVGVPTGAGAREFRGLVSRVVARDEFLDVVRDHFPR